MLWDFFRSLLGKTHNPLGVCDSVARRFVGIEQFFAATKNEWCSLHRDGAVKIECCKRIFFLNRLSNMKIKDYQILFVENLRTFLRYFGDNFLFLLVFSLGIGLSKNCVNTVSNLMSGNWLESVTLIPVGYAILYAGQLVAIFRRSRIAWILSLIQIVGLYFFSDATFGYLFNAVFRPITSIVGMFPIFLSIYLFVTEGFKTYFLYRKFYG